MVERVVEQRRELQPEVLVREHVLVERKVHDPGPGSCQASFLRVSKFARLWEGIRRLIEERIAGSAGIRIVDLIGPPRVREGIAQPVERFSRCSTDSSCRTR